MKLIDLHKEWCEKGELPNWGLCNSVPKTDLDLLDIFEPTVDNEFELTNNNMSLVFWGCEIEGAGFYSRTFAYTPLRQTIVLLICAMKNEI